MGFLHIPFVWQVSSHLDVTGHYLIPHLDLGWNGGLLGWGLKWDWLDLGV